MSRKGFFARITPLQGGHPDQGLPGEEEPVDPGYGVDVGGTPEHPIVLPPLPGVWPPAGKPSLPIYLPPEVWPGPGFKPMPPIHIPIGPDNTLPPNVGIWPPLPPDTGLAGKVAILVWVLGVGYRWFVYDAGLEVGGGPVMPTPSPK